ncbi:MAG: Stp1/IreP family PP2C-type Ser/Thr phosphatase [Paludibacteraceae bacterium]|nr:Stp1/IreP family PP2C-type Ser/Thr phosphatase [Paludibacteraceae bacterium]
MSLTIVNSDNVFQKDVIGNVRTAQEDSHDIAILTPNGDVFVVCDGMGGHVGGKQASSIAVKSIIEHLKNEKYDQPMQALNDALQFANMQILGYAKDHPELRGMGTTACIVLLQDTEAYIAHVGDSRIYLYMGKEQQLHRVTKDHSYVQTLVDAGQITDEEAEHHPNKNRILKALGIKPELVPTCNVLHPKNGDCFLICSDGLNGMITDSTIEGVLKQNIPLADKGERLIQLALEAGGHDNITVELIQITSSPHTQSQFISFNPASTKRTIPPTDKNKRTHTNHSSRIKKVALWFSAIVVFIVVCLLLISIVSYRSIKNQEENLRKQIYKTEQTIKEKRQQKEDIVQAFDEAQKQLKQMNMNTETSSASKTKEQEINLLEDNIKNIEEELDSLSKKQKNYQQELDKITKKSN